MIVWLFVNQQFLKFLSENCEKNNFFSFQNRSQEHVVVPILTLISTLKSFTHFFLLSQSLRNWVVQITIIPQSQKIQTHFIIPPPPCFPKIHHSHQNLEKFLAKTVSSDQSTQNWQLVVKSFDPQRLLKVMEAVLEATQIQNWSKFQ